MRVRYIYKTTCLVTGMYYLGMHSTVRPNVRYYGSGIRIKRSLEKYGKENHIVEILEYVDTEEQLKRRERELVDQVRLNDPHCLNLMIGGEGGFTSSQ